MTQETKITERFEGLPASNGAHITIETENGVPRRAYLNEVKIPGLVTYEICGRPNQVLSATFTVLVKEVLHRRVDS